MEEIPGSGIGDFPLLVSPRRTDCKDGTETRVACHWEQGIEGKDDNISERSRGHIAFRCVRPRQRRYGESCP